MKITTNLNRALSFIALFVFLPNIVFSQLLSTIDTRCLWIIRDSMTTKEGIYSAMNYAHQSGYNIVFVQVRGRGDAFYDSKIVLKNHLIDSQFDPLAYAINLGNELGIEVHAWVNCYILWSSKNKPKNKEHLYHTHPDWTESDLHGKMDWRIDLKSPKSPQWEGVYLSPLHPEVNLYLREVFKELIQNYKIDGIHLDYIRFQDEFYGYNPTGREEFKKIYNLDPRDIVRGIISTRYGWTQSFVDSMNIAWQSFKEDKVTELVSYVYEEIDNSGKEIKLSAAVKPNLLIARDRWFQNWQYWLENEIINFVVPMNYFPEIKDFNMSVQIMKNNLSPSELDRVYMGISTYNQDAQSAADKVLMSRLNGFHAVSIFSYNSHKNNLDWFLPVIDSFGNQFD